MVRISLWSGAMQQLEHLWHLGLTKHGPPRHHSFIPGNPGPWPRKSAKNVCHRAQRAAKRLTARGNFVDPKPLAEIAGLLVLGFV
jgi:hypothetical protein